MDVIIAIVPIRPRVPSEVKNTLTEHAWLS